MERIIKLSAQPQRIRMPELPHKEKLCIRTNEGIFVIYKTEILYLKSVSNYCEVHLRSGKRIFCSKTMKYFSERLSSKRFCRIHNSYLINLDAVEFIDTSFKNVKITGGVEVPLARSRQEYFKKQVSLLCD